MAISFARPARGGQGSHVPTYAEAGDQGTWWEWEAVTAGDKGTSLEEVG